MERNLSLDILRILACLGVIMIHTAGGAISNHMVEDGSLWFNEYLIMDALCRWSVPVFAMLTGFFLLDPKKDLPLKVLFSKYLARIVIALIAWSLFYAITLHISIYPFGIQGAHFWYLGMLIGLYLSLPILRLIANNLSTLKYYCIAWAVYMLYVFLGNFTELPFQLQDIIFLKYTGYCLVAYYFKQFLSNKEQNIVLVRIIYLLGIVGLIITITAALMIQNASTKWWLYDAPNVIATALAIFLFFVRHPLKLNSRVSSFIETCSKCTFGIYLMHMWILIQTFSRVHRFIPNPVALSFLCVGFAFCSAFFLTWIIKRIPVLNRYIV